MAERDPVEDLLRDPQVQADLATSGPLLEELNDEITTESAARRLKQQEMDDQAIVETLPQDDAGEPESRSELLFTILATAIPTLLGAAVGGSDGALAGLSTGAGSTAATLANRAEKDEEERVRREKEEAAAEAAEVARKEKREFEEFKSQLIIEREQQLAPIKRANAAAGKSTFEVHLPTGKLSDTEKIVQKDFASFDSSLPKIQDGLAAIRELKAIRESKGLGPETMFDAIFRNVKGEFAPSSKEGNLRKRAIVGAQELRKELFPGVTTEKENSTLQFVGGGSKRETLEALEAAYLSRLERAVNSMRSKTSLFKESGVQSKLLDTIDSRLDVASGELFQAQPTVKDLPAVVSNVKAEVDGVVMSLQKRADGKLYDLEGNLIDG